MVKATLINRRGSWGPEKLCLGTYPTIRVGSFGVASIKPRKDGDGDRTTIIVDVRVIEGRTMFAINMQDNNEWREVIYSDMILESAEV